MDKIKLNDGNEIPSFGLGTWKATNAGEAFEAVKLAIKIGYRHIDCAWVYNNEDEVGKAIRECIDEGIVSREDLWITSKLWNNRHHPDEVEKACRESLEALGLDYLDLYLVHWPMAFSVPFPSENDGYITLEEQPLEKTWAAMEDLKDKGLTRSIGVSNFSTSHLEEILASARTSPAMNQVELHPYLVQEKLMAYCREKNIALTAYSPLGSGGLPDPQDPSKMVSLLEDDTVMRVAQKHNTSVGAVLISWAIRRGTCVIPKSSNPDRIKQNLEASKLPLDDTDMVALEGLDRSFRFVNPGMWMGPNSPYSEDKLWRDD